MAELKLPIDREMNELLELGDRIVKMARDRGGADLVAECVLRSGAELSAKVRKGEPELVEEAGTRSAGLRVIQGKRVASTSTSDLTDHGIERFVADAIELVGLSQEDPFAGPADPKLLSDPGSAPDLDLYDPAGGAVDAARAIALAKEGEEAAFAFDSRITNSEGATFGRNAGGSAMVLSSGFRAWMKGSYQSLTVVPVAADEGGKNRRGYHWTARRHLAELDPPAEVGREAARRTLRKLGARTVPTCEAPVVFDPDAARSILGMLAGCAMGSAIWRKSSYLVGREGTRVASDLVTVVDDPLLKRAPGSRPFDGEGLASRRNVVVERGMLRTYLCDSYSARKLGLKTTGNAGGVHNLIATAPGHVVAIAELLKQAGSGLYVTELMGQGVNPVTGDYSRGASGFWVESGSLAYPVHEITIAGNLRDMYRNIVALGDDVDRRGSIHTGSVLVGEMTIGGE